MSGHDKNGSVAHTVENDRHRGQRASSEREPNLEKAMSFLAPWQFLADDVGDGEWNGRGVGNEAIASSFARSRLDDCSQLRMLALDARQCRGQKLLYKAALNV